jgi:predicted alpha/beta hydrolase
MLKRYMHNQERYHAFLEDNRVVHPFEWGTEYVTEHANGDDPSRIFRDFSKYTVQHSEDFFCSPKISDFKYDSSDSERIVTWTSGIETPSAENNTVYAKSARDQ